VKTTHRTWASPDRTTWRIEISNPGSSNAIVRFRHPDGDSARLDRYNWYISRGPEAKSVTGRLDPKKVAQALSDDDLTLLFRRSMPISRPADRMPEPAPASGAGG
jgi:hypothetical protein